MPDAAAEHDESPLTILLWSLFLGMSWTWCIGMFLPVILVREFGLAGWIVFAIPNVLGAAAMAWVLRTRESSARLTADHGGACAAFSWVTIAFHVFFVAWLVPGRLVNRWGMLLFLAAFAAFEAVGRKRPRNDLFSAAVTFCLSVILVALAVSGANGDDLATTRMPASRWSDAAILAAVCAFGFALCPYLDLTFHRARQQTSAVGARLAFSLGFGLFFLLMIVFSLWYAPYVTAAVATPRALPDALSWFLAMHLLVQAALTIVLHARHVPPLTPPASSSDAARTRHDMTGLSVVFGSLVLGIIVRTPRQVFSLDAGELVYRCFMGFYALVFPAYVWLCIIPARGAEAPTKRHLLVFASSVLIALPMFWLGFIHQRLIWLVPGLLVVLLARLAIPRGRS